MTTRTANRKVPQIDLPVAGIMELDDIFDRVTGTTAVAGNRVDLLIDAGENYPAWIAAIENAKHRIYFESYIMHDDEQGRKFADLLIKKAREGVVIKLLYDWMGGFGNTPRSFWRRLSAAGVEVRCYNPPKITDPLGVFSRDHRKSLIVDGSIAFVSGLCVGKDWVGDEAKGVAPWRDTGVAVNGPAVADVEAAFANVWATTGAPIERSEVAAREDLSTEGPTPVRVVHSVPGQAHMYRIDQLLASIVTESMWLTDAYFIGVPSYLQSLKDASSDGVDVRILVPQSTDITLIRDTTRSTYRPLLEAGIRVYEWNGTMVHAKTAVFDGRFSRVGSTNLNIASWFGNYELDVFIDDESFGAKMQEMFLRDLSNATEIVLKDTARTRRSDRREHRKRKRKGAGSVRKATAGAINAATSISSAIAKKSPLGAAEARLLFIVGSVPFLIALSFIFFPRASSIPLIAILLLISLPTLFKAVQNYRNN
jgi:cardiolipin synthase